MTEKQTRRNLAASRGQENVVDFRMGGVSGNTGRYLTIGSWICWGLVGLVVFFSSVQIIPPGHVGVLRTFGKVHENYLREGFNLKAPWTQCHVMSIREQVHSHSMNASSSKGIMIDIDLDVVYQLEPSAAVQMYRIVGPEYYEIRINPLINRIAKDVMVHYMAEDLYTGMRPVVNAEIEDELRIALEPLGINLLRAPIVNMEIPRDLIDALTNRQVEEYNVQTAQQRLAQERVEADRKRVEAEGIRDFQEIVSAEISERLLYWKYIEVMGTLAESPNNTFIILPTDILSVFPF
jgi:regulator of protease activity HflC (stomatin/prohibitin superfamily)